MTSPLDSSVAVTIKKDLITRLPTFIQAISYEKYLGLCNGLYQFSLQNQKTTLNEFLANINYYIVVINNSYKDVTVGDDLIKTHKPIELLDIYCNTLPTSSSDSSKEKLRDVINILMNDNVSKKRLLQFCDNILILAESDTIKNISRDKKILWFINTLIDVVNAQDGAIDGSMPKFNHIIPNIKDKCLKTVNDNHCYKLSKRTINSIICLFIFLLIIIIFLLLSKK